MDIITLTAELADRLFPEAKRVEPPHSPECECEGCKQREALAEWPEAEAASPR